MKRTFSRESLAFLVATAIVIGGIASFLVCGCADVGGQGSDEGPTGSSSPPPIDLLAPDVVKTASFGFG